MASQKKLRSSEGKGDEKALVVRSGGGARQKKADTFYFWRKSVEGQMVQMEAQIAISDLIIGLLEWLMLDDISAVAGLNTYFNHFASLALDQRLRIGALKAIQASPSALSAGSAGGGGGGKSSEHKGEQTQDLEKYLTAEAPVLKSITYLGWIDDPLEMDAEELQRPYRGILSDALPIILQPPGREPNEKRLEGLAALTKSVLANGNKLRVIGALGNKSISEEDFFMLFRDPAAVQEYMKKRVADDKDGIRRPFQPRHPHLRSIWLQGARWIAIPHVQLLFDSFPKLHTIDIRYHPIWGSTKHLSVLIEAMNIPSVHRQLKELLIGPFNDEISRDELTRRFESLSALLMQCQKLETIVISGLLDIGSENADELIRILAFKSACRLSLRYIAMTLGKSGVLEWRRILYGCPNLEYCEFYFDETDRRLSDILEADDVIAKSGDITELVAEELSLLPTDQLSLDPTVGTELEKKTKRRMAVTVPVTISSFNANSLRYLLLSLGDNSPREIYISLRGLFPAVEQLRLDAKFKNLLGELRVGDDLGLLLAAIPGLFPKLTSLVVSFRLDTVQFDTCLSAVSAMGRTIRTFVAEYLNSAPSLDMISVEQYFVQFIALIRTRIPFRVLDLGKYEEPDISTAADRRRERGRRPLVLDFSRQLLTEMLNPGGVFAQSIETLSLPPMIELDAKLFQDLDSKDAKERHVVFGKLKYLIFSDSFAGPHTSVANLEHFILTRCPELRTLRVTMSRLNMPLLSPGIHGILFDPITPLWLETWTLFYARMSVLNPRLRVIFSPENDRSISGFLKLRPLHWLTVFARQHAILKTAFNRTLTAVPGEYTSEYAKRGREYILTL
jgi:hypothetical protein